MSEIKRHYGNVMNKLITKKLYAMDFKHAFKSEKEDIKKYSTLNLSEKLELCGKGWTYNA